MDFETVVQEAELRARGIKPPPRIRARFAVEPELDEAQSQEQRKPVYRQTTWLYASLPGQPFEERFRATDEHLKTYAGEYKWFLDNEKIPTEGTPVGEWNAISATRAAQLKHAGILSVEQLADWDLKERPLSKENTALVALAQDYLSSQDEKDKRIEALEAEVKELQAKLADKPKRGRPKSAAPKEPESPAFDHGHIPEDISAYEPTHDSSSSS